MQSPVDDPGASRHNVAQMGFEVSRQLRFNGISNFACAIATAMNTAALLVILFWWGS